MQRENIVVLINGDKVEAWGSVKEACEMHGWKYNTVRRKKLPTVWKGWTIHRRPFRQLYLEK